MSRRAQQSVLVIGSSGLVGNAVVLAGQPDHDVTAASRSDQDPNLRVDLRDARSIRRAILETAHPPDVVILAAAVSSVVRCEVDPATTYNVNVVGSRTVVEAAADAKAKVVFLSSDYVFGDGGPHQESDDPAPMNEYGRQKLEVEEIVLSRSANVVVRTCQVFGQDARRANYVLATLDRLVAGEIVHARPDLFGTPTYVRDLAAEIIDLGTGPAAGVWHVAGPEFVSRMNLAQQVARAFNLDAGRILPAEGVSDDVPRPRMAGLRSKRGRPPLRSIDSALAALAREEQATS